MEMTGEQLIPLAQADVWRGLNDPEILKQCITGCDSIVLSGDNEYKVSMTAAVGPVKAKFAGKMPKRRVVTEVRAVAVPLAHRVAVGDYRLLGLDSYR